MAASARAIAGELGSIGLLRRGRAEYVGAKVVAGDTGGLLDRSDVMSSHGAAPGSPLRHQRRVDLQGIRQGLLATDGSDRSTDWALHGRRVASLSIYVNSGADRADERSGIALLNA